MRDELRGTLEVTSDGGNARRGRVPGVRRPEEAFVFVRRGSEFLVLHRSPRQGAYWHGVAGALEAGETAARRRRARIARGDEARRRRRHAAGEPYTYPLSEEPRAGARSTSPDVTEIVVTPFIVDAPPGWEPTLDWEHDDYRWCAPLEAGALFHWPEPAELLRRLIRA